VGPAFASCDQSGAVGGRRRLSASSACSTRVSHYSRFLRDGNFSRNILRSHGGF
jgi:hypothetical protein